MITSYLADALAGNPDATQLSTFSICLLVVAVGLALAFEFVNGFHDTANAVATVIYTHTMKPWVAVVWSGCFNLLGVLWSSGGVAFSILALLPTEMVTHVSSGAGFAMVFSILISAILWNLGTWWLGLPASSSHTLIGAIVGVGLANSVMMPGHSFGDGVNWGKVWEVGASLLLSPIVGFFGTAALIYTAKKWIKWPSLFQAPDGNKPPPNSVRGLLILTCTGVSFFHGSNDGQKGMGLVLLILIGIMPATYAMNLKTSPDQIRAMHDQAVTVDKAFGTATSATEFKGTAAVDGLTDFLKGPEHFGPKTLPQLAALAHDIAVRTDHLESLASLPVTEREALRNELFVSSKAIDKLATDKMVAAGKVTAGQKKLLAGYQKNCLDPATHNIPFWVKLATALALGLGTMIGWKRIVVTVGEKIGKQHLTYAQGASAELMAAVTIGLSDGLKLPVSTTHVLSSGVAGTMVASGSGVQMATVRNLLVAWVLTLPVCVLLGAGLFAAGLEIAISNFIPVVVAVVAVVGVVFVIWRLRSLAGNRGEPVVQPM
jgi:PiT family inorganic phosphate transporter